MYIYSEVFAKKYVVINSNGSIANRRTFNFQKLILASFVVD